MAEDRRFFKRLFGKKKPEQHGNAISDAVSDTPPASVGAPDFPDGPDLSGRSDLSGGPDLSDREQTAEDGGMKGGRAPGTATSPEKVFQPQNAPGTGGSAESPSPRPDAPKPLPDRGKGGTGHKHTEEKTGTVAKPVSGQAQADGPASPPPERKPPFPDDALSGPRPPRAPAGIMPGVSLDDTVITARELADALGASAGTGRKKAGGIIRPLPDTMMPEPIIPLIKEDPASLDPDFSDTGTDTVKSVEDIADTENIAGTGNKATGQKDTEKKRRAAEDRNPEKRNPEEISNGTGTPPRGRSLFARLSSGLSRSSGKLSHGVADIFTRRKLDDETLEALEDLLISADLGVGVAGRLTGQLGKDKFNREVTGDEIRAALAAEVERTLSAHAKPLLTHDTGNDNPVVILMAGVNGAGKTTTIAKIAKQYIDTGKSVMMVAGDTFRAAATDQLSVWGDRVGAQVVKRETGADAAGLAYDALVKARTDKIDIVLIDTAGRLQNKAELMDELAKIIRVIKKVDETAPHHRVLVLDATVGQNALSQTAVFHEVADITGLVMTKLDGTAKGGILVSLADKFALPIHYIGVGEGVDDLQRFDARSFSRALTGL